MALTTKTDLRPDKVMLRVRNGGQIGATAFFRNRALLAAVDAEARTLGVERLRVLFHAVSLGAEVYSFLIHSRMTGLDRSVELEVSATDLNPNFIAYAREARYPADAIAALGDEECAWFTPAGTDTVSPAAAICEAVTFLPAMSFVDAVLPDTFDIVFVNNALTYVTPEQQALALDRIAAYNAHYLILSAFHPATIEADLRRNGYSPVPRDRVAIHNGWSERFGQAGSDHSWQIRPVADIAEGDYRLTSLFVKSRG